MFLIKQAQVYAPEYLGVKDVLICGGKIEAIEDHIDDHIPFSQVIDGTGKKLTPGIIDPHVHITGGGGEGSFHTQVPPVKLSELIGGGVTTVVGLLGTDGISRNVESLLARVKALREEGLTVYALTGSYGCDTDRRCQKGHHVCGGNYRCETGTVRSPCPKCYSG